MEDVAAEAGVSKTLIYYHFRDRAGLVTSALEYVNDRAEGYADIAEDDDSPPMSCCSGCLPRNSRTMPPYARTPPCGARSVRRRPSTKGCGRS